MAAFESETNGTHASSLTPKFQKQFEMCLRFVIKIFFNDFFCLLKNPTNSEYQKKVKGKRKVIRISMNYRLRLKSKENYIMILAIPKIKS